MKRSQFSLTLAFALASVASGCCFAFPVEPSRITDDPVRRAEATAVANAYLSAHRSELVQASSAAVAETRIQGGSIDAMSETAFEVSLVLAPNDTQAAVVVVYVVAETPARAVGAQSRSGLGDVLFDLGDRLDRRFTSRD